MLQSKGNQKPRIIKQGVNVMSARKTTEQFVKELNDNNVEVLSDYITNKTKIKVRYRDCGHCDMKAPIKLLAGQRCSVCKGKTISKAKTKNTEEYQSDLIKNEIDYIKVIGQYKGVKCNVEVLNTKCNHTYSANAGNILNGSGCPICYGHKDAESFQRIIEQKYPNEYKINEEYINGLTPISITHKCGYEWKVTPKDLLREFRCPRCNSSKGERYIELYLKDKGIKFDKQYKFNDCRDINPLPFDFRIIVNGETRLIEFDGSQHYENTMYHTEKVTLHDNMKNKYCHDNNIKLLRIPYWWLKNDRIDRELDKFIA